MRTSTGKRVRSSRSKTPSRRSKVTKTSSRFPRLTAVSNGGLTAGTKTRFRTSFFMNAVPSAAGVFTGYLSTGSVNDPGGSLVAGIQPMGYDYLKSMYGRFTVLGGTVKVTAMIAGGDPASATLHTAFGAVMYPSNGTTVAVDFQDASSQPDAIVKSARPDDSVILYRKFSHAKLLGASKIVPELHGAVADTDPSPNQFIKEHLFIQDVFTPGATHSLFVEIVQDVWCDRRINNTDV